jgi:RimJ/RimL family protein N-acetyltransferase
MIRSPLPTLHTPRLTLRPLTVSDTDGVMKMIRDSQAEFTQWFGWASSSTRPAVKEYIQSAEEAMALGTAWHYVILLWSGKLVGRVGLSAIDPDNLSAELGYMLRTDTEGNGIMTEAARGLLAHAFGPGNLHRVVAYADCENERSRRILTRLGFQQEGVVRHMSHHPERGWRDHCSYSLLDGELRG